jgi:hypothetical protein
LYLNPRL